MTPPEIGLDELVSRVVTIDPSADPLALLSNAVELSGRISELADQLIGHFVDQARQSGATWSEIGQHMGVSKQAAQKRFVPRDSAADADFPTRRSLKRFTPRARSVIAFAKAEAKRLGSSEINNEHLVLGLVSEPEGLAAKIMVALGVPLEQIQGAVLAMVKPVAKAPRSVRFERATKKTIELSLGEAIRLEHHYIGTEHLLLGLLRNDREDAARLLIGLGVTLDRAEEQLVIELAAIK